MMMLLVLSLMLSGSSAESAAGPRVSQAKKASIPTCWQQQDEVENEVRESGSVPRLPATLRQEKVKGSVVAFKLCIDNAGAVASVVTRVSSGNTKIDDFFRSSLSKWKYHPRRVASEDRPSVAFVTVTFAIPPEAP